MSNDTCLALPDSRIEREITTTRIFHRTLYSRRPIVVNRGGAGSSKSYSIMQVLISKMCTENNKKFLIMCKTLPQTKLAVFMPMMSMMSDMGLMHQVSVNRSDFGMRFRSNFIQFGSLDDPEKIKSTEWNYIWFEEATSFTLQDFNLTLLRLRAPSKDGHMNQFYLSFNPVDEYHWIKESLLEGEYGKDSVEIVSTYLNNPYLPEFYVKRLEGLINQDPAFYRIYSLGEWGRLEHLIYKNWKAVDTLPLDYKPVCYGMDFGFNDPTVLTAIQAPSDSHDRIVRGETPEAHIQELLYESGMTNNDLIKRMNEMKVNKRIPIYADSAEPARIEEIRRAGYVIRPAEKDLHDGIDYVKRFRLMIPKDSMHTLKEVSAYSWKTDRQGRVQDQPVDFMNHACDTIRYQLYTHFAERNVPSVRWI